MLCMSWEVAEGAEERGVYRSMRGLLTFCCSTTSNCSRISYREQTHNHAQFSRLVLVLIVLLAKRLESAFLAHISQPC